MHVVRPGILLLLSMAGTAVATPTGTGLISLIPIDSFPLVSSFDAKGIAVDETTLYVTFGHELKLDTYDMNGGFQGTIPLTGVTTYLGGFTGITNKSATELYLAAMFAPSRESAVYRFDKTGVFQHQANLNPPIDNVSGVAFDGTDGYVTQNDNPYLA